MKWKSIYRLAGLLVIGLGSCHLKQNNKEGSKDPASIARGSHAFNELCGGCHNFHQSSIGPSLDGLQETVSADWLRRFIADPKTMIASGDTLAQRLHSIYKSVMPSFGYLPDSTLEDIIAFLYTQKKHARTEKDDKRAIADPLPERVAFSGLQVGLELVAALPGSTSDSLAAKARITKMDFAPRTNRVFIVDLRGHLYELTNGKASLYFDIAGREPAFIHEPRLATGFGSFAFHPDFVRNGLFYTTHSEKARSQKADFSYADSIPVAMQWVVTEWKANDPQAKIFSGEGRELLRIDMVSGMHGVQEIAFNDLARPGQPDYGKLYVCVGDGASVEEGFPDLVHRSDRVWGTILRIDPAGKNSANGHYGIPNDNPFAGQAKTVGEIYALGFRNPHRITWDSKGQMLVSNIGQAHIESVNLVLPGHDYGWPVREGRFLIDPLGDINTVYQLPEDASAGHFTYPVAEYDHDEGNAISGGYEYRGSRVPMLKRKFFFGDIPTGRLFYIDLDDVGQGRHATVKEWKVALSGKPATLLALCGHERADLHFGRDASGELYILTKADGKVYRLSSATQVR